MLSNWVNTCKALNVSAQLMPAVCYREGFCVAEARLPCLFILSTSKLSSLAELGWDHMTTSFLESGMWLEWGAPPPPPQARPIKTSDIQSFMLSLCVGWTSIHLAGRPWMPCVKGGSGAISQDLLMCGTEVGARIITHISLIIKLGALVTCRAGSRA